MLGVGVSMALAAVRGAASATGQLDALADALYDVRRSVKYQTALGSTPATATDDPIGYVQDMTGQAPAVQGATGSRPTVQNGGWQFDGADDRLNGFRRRTIMASSRYTVPDVSDSDEGKGYTCTGKTLDTSDDTFWDGNDGRSNPADVTHRSSLVNTTRAGVFIREIDIEALFPNATSIQGVVYDASDDTLWFASKGENLIRHIEKDGTSIGSFAYTSPNGLAINTVTAELIVTTDSGNLSVFTKAGVEVGSTFHMSDTFDHIFYNSATGLLYYTRNSAADGDYIGVVHLPSRQFVTRFMVPEADQMEGIVVVGDTIYVNNDGYYHDSITDLNETLIYELGAAPAYTPQTKVTLFAKFTCAAPSGTRSLLSANSGISNGGAGIWPIGSSSTSLRIFVNSSAGTAERDSVDFTGLPDFAAAVRYLVLEIDTVAKELRLWVDGTQYGGTKALTNVAGGFSTGLLVLAAAKDNSNELACTIKAAGVANRLLSASAKAMLHADLAAA